jgi:hypothetical protein
MATTVQANGPFEEVPLDNDDARSVSSESSYDLLSDDEAPDDCAAATEEAALTVDVAPQPNDNQVEANDFQDVEIDAKRAQLRSKLAATFQDLMSMINYADDSNPTDADTHTNLFRRKANEISALFGDDVDELKDEIQSLSNDMSSLETLLVESKRKQVESQAHLRRLNHSEALLKERLREVKVDLSLAEGEKAASKMETRQRALDLEALTKKHDETVQEKQDLARDYRAKRERSDECIRGLRKEVELLCEKANALRIEKTQSKNRNKDLENHISDLNSHAYDAYLNLQSEQNRSINLARDVESSKIRISELQQAEEEAVRNNMTLKGKAANLAEQLELAQEREKTFSAEKRELKACVARLQDEKRASVKAYTHYERRITEFKTTIERMTKDLDAAQEKVKHKEECTRSMTHERSLALREAGTRTLQLEGMTRRLDEAQQKIFKAEQKATKAEQRANEAERRATEAEQRANEAQQKVTETEQRAHEAEKGFLVDKATAEQINNARYQKYREACWRAIRDHEVRVKDARKEASAAKEQAAEAEEKLKQFRKFQDAVAEKNLKMAVKDEGETKTEEVTPYTAWTIGMGFPDSLKTFTYHQLHLFTSTYKGTTPVTLSQIGMTSEEKLSHQDTAQEWNKKSEAHLKNCKALELRLSELQRQRWKQERAPSIILESSREAEKRRTAARAIEQPVWDAMQLSAYMAGRARELALYAENNAMKVEKIAKQGSTNDLFAAAFLEMAYPNPNAKKTQAAEQKPKQSKKKSGEITREDIRAVYHRICRLNGTSYANTVLVRDYPDYLDLMDEDVSAYAG